MNAKSFKLGFRNRTPADKVAICRRVVHSLANVPAGKRTLVPLAALQTRLAEAEAALARVPELRAELRAAISARNRIVAALCTEVTRGGKGYYAEVGGDAAELQAGGLELPKSKSPVGRPDAPGSFRAERTASSGTVRLRWKRPVRRCVFTIEYTADAAGQTDWQHHSTQTSSRCDVEGLEPGRLYWFRAAAINAHGRGPWTQSIAVRPG